MSGNDTHTAILTPWVVSDTHEQPLIITSHQSFDWEGMIQHTAQIMACEQHAACGTCPGCKQVISGNHPDVVIITDEEGKITIKHVREKLRVLRVTPISGKRLIVFQRAHLILPETANTLLKELEEGSRTTRFLLTTHLPRKILPTILSRCRIVRIPHRSTDSKDIHEALPAILNSKRKNPFTEEEMQDIGTFLKQTLRTQGYNPEIYRCYMRYRDAWAIRQMPGGNTKLASDVLLACLQRLRHTTNRSN